MAQNYVGSNNINLLEPNGQFGTRLHGGDDSASERYIFTLLNSLTRFLFPETDDSVLNYLNDDGTIVEPEYYVPIIPFALINGITGIGTGFSCNISPYNPSTVIQYLKNKLSNKSNNLIEFIPYYEGFNGSVSKITEQKFLIKGKYNKIADDKIQITELPVGTWTMSYTSFLESLVDGGSDKNGKRTPTSIRDFTSISTEVKVDFTVIFPRGKLASLESEIDANNCNGVEKLLKLFTTVSTTNMHMFNSECKLKKYLSPEEIIEEFYDIRINLYQKRKNYLINEMEKKLIRLSNRAKYIQETLNGTIDLRRKKSEQVTEMLIQKQYATIDGDFKYLIKMPMDSVTEENVLNIMKEKEITETELDKLKNTTLEKMWMNELNVLEKEYAKYKTKREKIQAGEISSNKKTVSSTKKKVVKKKK